MTANLLEHLKIELACHTCDATYAVPASIVRDSQHVLAQGCSGASIFECDASYYASLIDPDVIEALDRAWTAFRDSAEANGGLGVVIDASDADDYRPDSDTRALRRWENEGGRCEPGGAQPRGDGDDR